MLNWIILGVLFTLPTPKNEMLVERAIEDAMLDLVLNGIKKENVKPWKKNPVAVNEKYRKRLARAMAKASIKHEIPPMLLVATAFKESSFVSHVRGARGEIGLYQIAKRLGKWLEKTEKCSMKTIEGRSYCAAFFLKKCIDSCHTYMGAFARYMFGEASGCKKNFPPAVKRYNIALYLTRRHPYRDKFDFYNESDYDNR